MASDHEHLLVTAKWWLLHVACVHSRFTVLSGVLTKHLYLAGAVLLRPRLSGEFLIHSSGIDTVVTLYELAHQILRLRGW